MHAENQHAQTGFVQVELPEVLPREAKLCGSRREVCSMQAGVCSEEGHLLCSGSGSVQPASGTRMCRSGQAG